MTGDEERLICICDKLLTILQQHNLHHSTDVWQIARTLIDKIRKDDKQQIALEQCLRYLDAQTLHNAEGESLLNTLCDILGE